MHQPAARRALLRRRWLLPGQFGPRRKAPAADHDLWERAVSSSLAPAKPCLAERDREARSPPPRSEHHPRHALQALSPRVPVPVTGIPPIGGDCLLASSRGPLHPAAPCWSPPCGRHPFGEDIAPPFSRQFRSSAAPPVMEASSEASASSSVEQEASYTDVGRYSHSPLSFYDVTVEKFAELPHRPFTLKQLLHFGEQAARDPGLIVRSARFVQREMPIRLAKRLMDLQFLPHIVVTNPHIMEVYQAYRKAFDLLRCFPRVNTQEDNVRFTQVLTALVDESAPLLDVLARGVRECYTRPLVGRQLLLDSFLDNMLRSRISRRVMCEQHIQLQRARPGFIGIICTEVSVRDAVHKAATQCTDVCFRTYGTAPKFTIRGDLETSFPYIPAHLDYILFEIFKNASRAVVECWMSRARASGRRVSGDALPPVIVTICRGKKDVTLRVSDQGGGIPEDSLPLVWSYGYTTVDDTLPLGKNSSSGLWTENKSPMAGLGFGLPLSRVHAQYLGGDLSLVSIPDYGTDIYIRVHSLGDHAESFEI